MKRYVQMNKRINTECSIFFNYGLVSCCCCCCRNCCYCCCHCYYWRYCFPLFFLYLQLIFWIIETWFWLNWGHTYIFSFFFLSFFLHLSLTYEVNANVKKRKKRVEIGIQINKWNCLIFVSSEFIYFIEYSYYVICS